MVQNPATEEVLAQCPRASKSQLDAAVGAAKAAFPAWSATPPTSPANGPGSVGRADCWLAFATKLDDAMTSAKPTGESAYEKTAKLSCLIGCNCPVAPFSAKTRL